MCPICNERKKMLSFILSVQCVLYSNNKKYRDKEMCACELFLHSTMQHIVLYTACLMTLFDKI